VPSENVSKTVRKIVFIITKICFNHNYKKWLKQL